jgi:hypothetical protein
LDGGQLIEDCSRSERQRQWLEPRAQCDVKTIGDEGDEDMRDAPLELMTDGARLQIVLHGFEGGLDLDELENLSFEAVHRNQGSVLLR